MDTPPFPCGADASSSTWTPYVYLMVDLMVAMRHAVYKQDPTLCTLALYFVLEPLLAHTFQCLKSELAT